MILCAFVTRICGKEHPLIAINVYYVAVQQLQFDKTDFFGETGLFQQTQLLVDFSLRIGRLQLVAGRQHGQATNHTIHIKAIGRTGTGFDAGFG